MGCRRGGMSVKWTGLWRIEHDVLRVMMSDLSWLCRYTESLQGAVGEAPVVPSRIDELHKLTAAQVRRWSTSQITS